MLKQRSYRLLSFMVTFCMIMAMLPVASAEGSIISVNSSDENAVRNALSQAQDGDIIEITGTGFINDTNSDGAPWVIDKAVTIRGAGTDPSLLIRSGGIILGADVSFENIKLSLPNHIRNAIIANGYTLTLTSVTRDTSARAIHLFCGGRTLCPANQPGQLLLPVLMGRLSSRIAPIWVIYMLAASPAMGRITIQRFQPQSPFFPAPAAWGKYTPVERWRAM